MTEQEKILEEIKRNLGEERLDEILDSVRSFFSGPGRGARPASKPATATSGSTSTSRPPADINPTAAARANIGDNSLGGDDTPPAMQKIQAARPTAPAAPAAPAAVPAASSAQRTGSIRAGLNRAGLGTDQSGVVGGATPADRARPATAAPEASSFAPANVAKQQQANRAAADDRDAADMASQASNRAAPAAKPSEPSTSSNVARMAPGAMTGGSFKASAPSTGGAGNTLAPSMSMGAGGGLSPVGSSVGKPAEPATKAPAAVSRQAAPAASSAPAQPSRSSQMFQAASNKGDDATSADFFRADRQAQAERKSAPAAPQKPQQSNADYMKSSGMVDEANLERKIRKMFEQKSAKFTGGGADIQDLSGPNKPVGQSEKEQHHGVAEENIQEISGTATGFGGRHNPKRSQAKSTLGGNKMKTRASLQRSGNQKAAGRYEEYNLSESRKAVFEKVKEKKMKGSRTDTGSPADPIDTEPSKPSMTGY